MITADTRYSFTPQFLHGAAMFAHRAHAIEQEANITEELKARYRAYVLGAIVQAAAALDAEVSEVIMHGPGHHLGSNGVDTAARDKLLAAGIISKKPLLRRYGLVLGHLGKPPLARDAPLHQSADLLIKLRNELIHYKSKWGAEMTDQKDDLFSRLEKLGYEKPRFMPLNTNFFPHRCLSASLASWSVTTGVEFLNHFYSKLGVSSPLDAYSARLQVPPPRM